MGEGGGWGSGVRSGGGACTRLVILSWVGFWINREATGDCIALGEEGAGLGGGGWGLG